MINKLYSSRVIIIQNIYSQSTNPEAKLDYKKSQFKKFIKDVTEGTLERRVDKSNYFRSFRKRY